MPPPTSATPFGPRPPLRRPARRRRAAEEVIVSMIEHALDADPRDTAALIAFDLSLRLRPMGARHCRSRPGP
jgi:hypothetical protein